MIARLLAFVAVFGVLQAAWQWSEGTELHPWLIDRGIVAPAAALARQITPSESVVSEGNVLRGAGTQLRIVNGCDGTETLFLLCAGFAVAPIPWRRRALGLLLGLPFVYALNQARILGLYYSLRADAGLFDALHGIVTPVLMVVAVLWFYYAWLGPRSRLETTDPR